MTRYLSLGELLSVYLRLMEATGEKASIGKGGLSKVNRSASRPRSTVGSTEVYRTLAQKAGAMGTSLAVESRSAGQLRFAHAALETMLVLNGFEIDATVDEQEHVMREVADRRMDERALAVWIEAHCVQRS